MVRTSRISWIGVVWVIGAAACASTTSSSTSTSTSSPTEASADATTQPAPERLSAAGGSYRPAALSAALAEAWRTRPTGYVPRTRHVDGQGRPKHTNRLFLQTSPYLQQHAHNPVDWFPWGDEAFAAATAQGRPILLSVGYSTCHWCHVMEEESFEDEEIAAYINEHYVAIKVDREERPDIDDIYMAAVQALTGRGGWPMTVWLTPGGEPFYGGTYFPARDGDRGTRAGFLTLLQRLRGAWDDDPEQVAQKAAKLAETIRRRSRPQGRRGPVGASIIRAAVDAYRQRFDATHGGVGRAPKFPSSLPVDLLLRYHRRTGDADVLSMVTLTLDRMARGGMYDQVGGGFHRYSTDARWLVPHFEKMLYDNALLVMAYLDAYQATGRADFAAVVHDILRYVERDMTSPDGGFYSATDADSLVPGGHREEGWFFTWTPAEIEAVLGVERAQAFGAVFPTTAVGNFEGRNILERPTGDAQALRDLAPDREKLYLDRQQRPAPLRDDKILAAWNGLMIAAFARAARVLDVPRYAELATRAARFVDARMTREGRLFRSFKGGDPRHNGYLEDYAFMVEGLLELFFATSHPEWVQQARRLDAVLERHYEDVEGGWYTTSDDHETLLARQKPHYDGAEPSGNSVHTLNLLRLHTLTGDDRYRQRAERAISAFSGSLKRHPTGLSVMLSAVEHHLDRPREVVIMTPDTRQSAAPLLEVLRRTYLPNYVLVVTTPGPEQLALAAEVPLVKHKVVRNGRPTAYVCERGMCKLPTTDPKVLAQQLAQITPLP